MNHCHHVYKYYQIKYMSGKYELYPSLWKVYYMAFRKYEFLAGVHHQ